MSVCGSGGGGQVWSVPRSRQNPGGLRGVLRPVRLRLSEPDADILTAGEADSGNIQNNQVKVRKSQSDKRRENVQTGERNCGKFP